jgi:hypothetical protein
MAQKLAELVVLFMAIGGILVAIGLPIVAFLAGVKYLWS